MKPKQNSDKGRALPFEKFDPKKQQPFYKTPVRFSQNSVVNTVGLFCYAFQRHHEDFAYYASQVFLSELDVPIKIFISQPNRIYLEVSLYVKNPHSLTWDQEQAEVRLVQVLNFAKNRIERFFREQFNWDRVVQKNLTDEYLLDVFRTTVIEPIKQQYYAKMTENNR